MQNIHPDEYYDECRMNIYDLISCRTLRPYLSTNREYRSIEIPFEILLNCPSH